MFAAAVGHRSGRATPSLRDAPQQQSMEIVGRETIYRNRNAVQTNPATSIDRWHGALDHKDTYTRRFLEQSDQSLRDGSYDTRKLEIVLSALIVEATALAVGDFAPADGD